MAQDFGKNLEYTEKNLFAERKTKLESEINTEK